MRLVSYGTEPMRKWLGQISNNDADCRNEGGDSSKVVGAIEYIIGDTADVTSFDKQIYSEDTLRELLRYTPVIIGRREYLGSGFTQNDHFTIIYDCYQDALTGRWLYCVYDPSNKTEIHYLTCSYDWICDGSTRTYDTDPEVDRRIWDCVVVFAIGDYQNTTAPVKTNS